MRRVSQRVGGVVSEPAETGRRRLLQTLLGLTGAWLLGGCSRLSQSEWFPQVLGLAERANAALAPRLASRRSLAPEFTLAEVSARFPANGNSMPDDIDYQALAASGFGDYRLEVDGLVESPASLSLPEIRALASRTQITRHDCVEGWSAIAQWKGARLAALLDQVRPLPNARFCVFHCADPMGPEGAEPYYESIDLDDARHEQTILAYEMNGVDLPVAHGAPLRLRVERQLGYKHAKYVMRIELVESFDRIRGGRGGYWEDQGYQWFAGI